MSNIRLPKQLEKYFVLEELPRTGHARRFCLYLPYKDGSKDTRCRSEWKVSSTQEAIDENAVEDRLEHEKSEFRSRIERWLKESGKVLTGNGPVPELRDRDDA